MKVEEAQEVRAMVRRIAAILLLGPELDASYRAVTGVIASAAEQPAFPFALDPS